jgi:hypothetical protein
MTQEYPEIVLAFHVRPFKMSAARILIEGDVCNDPA